PDPIVSITPDDWKDGTGIIERANAFADGLMRGQKLWTANQPPARQKDESDDAYAQRFNAFRESSLFETPSAFFDQIDAVFRATVGSDQTPTSALAVMGLAGPTHIYGKAQVELPTATLKAMIDKGRANVQRFAAA